MRFPILCFLFILCTSSVQAQNWKTVISGDSTYFKGGPHKSKYPVFGSSAFEYSNILKFIFIDDITVAGTDSIFSFYRTMRSEGLGQCYDTVAATWLGTRFIRQNNGTELYFNSLGDTITIKTLAVQGDNWILAKDTGNLVFHATVTIEGQTIVEGMPDSFKQLTIQAYQNGNPVPHPYNNKMLELSKEHGWLRTLDMYRFPNLVNSWEEFGAVTDSVEMLRMDNDFAHVNLNFIDLSWKYAPGNEWIHHQEQGTPQYGSPYNGAFKHIRHDSIINSTLINSTTVVADILTRWYSVGGWQHPTFNNPYWDSSVTTGTYLHTDTIESLPQSIIVNNIHPELVHPSVDTYLSNTGYKKIRHFVDSFCNKRTIKEYREFGIFPDYYNNCLRAMSSISGGSSTTATSMPGFGGIEYCHASSGFSMSALDIYSKHYYSYLKLPGCTSGTKIDVIALTANPITRQEPYITIYPNPADGIFNIQSSITSAEGIVQITDITGKKLVEQKGLAITNTFDLSSFPKGIYIIALNIANQHYFYKLAIQ